MTHRIEGNRLIVEFDPDSKTKSSTGKTFLLATSNGYQEGTMADGTKIGISYNITSPFSPCTPQNPPVNLPGAIRQHLKARQIWHTFRGRYALNDEVSRQVRRDTVRFRIADKHRRGA